MRSSGMMDAQVMPHLVRQDVGTGGRVVPDRLVQGGAAVPPSIRVRPIAYWIVRRLCWSVVGQRSREATEALHIPAVARLSRQLGRHIIINYVDVVMRHSDHTVSHGGNTPYPYVARAATPDPRATRSDVDLDDVRICLVDSQLVIRRKSILRIHIMQVLPNPILSRLWSASGVRRVYLGIGRHVGCYIACRYHDGANAQTPLSLKVPTAVYQLRVACGGIGHAPRRARVRVLGGRARRHDVDHLVVPIRTVSHGSSGEHHVGPISIIAQCGAYGFTIHKRDTRFVVNRDARWPHISMRLVFVVLIFHVARVAVPIRMRMKKLNDHVPKCAI